MKPELIRHRVNLISDLQTLPEGLGAEIDLRSTGDSSSKKIHVTHDPWTMGDDFEEWLKVYSAKARGTLILNTKEDGLESRTLELLEKYAIRDYFFLDTTPPTLVEWSLRRKRQEFALRVSRYETVHHAFIGRVAWAWLDCFDGRAIETDVFESLCENFKICLVSPELHGLQFESLEEFLELGLRADAICTKFPDRWTQILEAQRE